MFWFDRLLLSGVFAGAALALTAPSQTPDDGPIDTSTALRLQRQKLEAAIGRGDAATVAGLFTADGSLMVAEFDPIRGRQMIQRAWEFALGSKAVTGLVLTPEEFEGLDGDLAIESGKLVTLDRDGKEGAPSHYLLVWKREDGAWRICRDIVSPRNAPASSVDRVGFPRDYRHELSPLTPPAFNAKLGVVQTAYGNATAAQALGSATLPYPNGSVIALEFAEAVKDAAGHPVLKDGLVQRGLVLHVDVMRRDSGFGEAYGRNRAGEWEFVSYQADGSYFKPPAASASCAACHRREAGAANDFVFPLTHSVHP